MLELKQIENDICPKLLPPKERTAKEKALSWWAKCKEIIKVIIVGCIVVHLGLLLLQELRELLQQY